MRQVINGKVYDSSTATLLAEYEYGLPGDLDHLYEAICKTPKGSYFIYGIGGPMTKYGRYVGKSTMSGGSEITPITRQDAFRWCLENHAPAEVIEREFPDMVEEA